MRKLILALALAALTLPAFAQKTTVTIATVNNPDMVTMQKLSKVYMDSHPDVEIRFVVLPDLQLRQNVTQDVATNAGQYDVATISPYEVQSGWVANGWVAPLTPMFDALPADQLAAYDLGDLITPIKDALSVDGTLYALPFYGESSFTMYRKDLFDQAGLTMPEHPTWDDIRSFACQLNDPSNDFYGIAMKGIAQYGQLAPFITFMHSYGAKWFDMNWQPQITSPEFRKAFTAYIDLVKQCGEPGASTVGFNEALTLMSQGRAAIWVDATVAAGFLEDPSQSQVAGKMGFAFAPTEGSTNGSSWLYTWALGILSSSKHKDAAFDFIRWATSKDYIQLVADQNGWVRVPPGTRYSTYANPAYQEAAPFAPMVLQAIEASDLKHPAKDPVPYTGTAQVNIPEFSDWAATFAQNFSAVVAGKMTIDEALTQSQQVAEKVMKEAGYIQ